MYITINSLIGEKTIDLDYPIRNLNFNKEVAVIRMLSDNVQYEMTEAFKLELTGGHKKQVLNKAYTPEN